MARQKSEPRAPMTEMPENIHDAIARVNSGERPDGSPLAVADAKAILQHFLGDHGTVTQEIQSFKDDILATENRAVKATSRRAIASLRAEAATLRATVADFRANNAVQRARNASYRRDKTEDNAKARFLRAYKILAATDPAFLSLFAKNPAAVLADFEAENKTEAVA